MIVYRDDGRPALEEARELYRASTLGERRPIDDDARFARMLAEANLIVTAWDGALLVGIARALSDFSYATYLSDLAVRASHQRRGIGRELIRRTRLAAPRATLILLAAPAAERYYPHLGFERHAQAWLLREADALR
jgi:GNAT superfamily N-acetyltransferase